MGLQRDIGLDHQEMEPDDETKGHAGQPEGLPEEISEGLGPPPGGEPVVAMGDVEALRHVPDHEESTDEEELESETERRREQQVRGAAHPTVGLSHGIEMGGDTVRQLRSREDQ